MINELQTLRDAFINYTNAYREMAEVNSTFNNVFRCELSDLSLIPKIYAWYQEIAEENNFSADAPHNNKQFMFIILLLYSPRSIYGFRMNRPLRQALSSSLGLKYDSSIYKATRKCLTWYHTYQTFEMETDMAYDTIYNMLLRDGFILPKSMDSLP